MSHHTRRQFLGFVASLLTLVDAVRRFFKPPEVVDRRSIWDVIDEHKREIEGRPEVITDPLTRKRMFLALLQKKGSIRLNCTGPDFKNWPA